MSKKLHGRAVDSIEDHWASWSMNRELEGYDLVDHRNDATIGQSYRPSTPLQWHPQLDPRQASLELAQQGSGTLETSGPLSITVNSG